MTTNPLPQLIPACQRIARLCGVEMPSRALGCCETYINGKPAKGTIPDDLYALMLVGWVVEKIVPSLIKDDIHLDSNQGRWTTCDNLNAVCLQTDLTAAITAACEILDGRGEVG